MDGCVHDFLDPNTSVVVHPHYWLAWCCICGRRRVLGALDEASSRAAVAALNYILFANGDTHGRN
jgi:hypothetical protein